MEEDRYTRITLRLPKELHAQLQKAADDTSKSMNAEIVARLQGSFSSQSDAGLWGHFVTMIRDNLSRHGARDADEVEELVRAIDGLLFFLQNPLEPQPGDSVSALFQVMTKKPAK